MKDWVDACAASDIDEEDLIRWDHNGKSYAIYNTEKGFFATDGMCTHEAQHLEDGLVTGMVIECPLHQGRFDIKSGKALSAPVCVDLQNLPDKDRSGAGFRSDLISRALEESADAQFEMRSFDPYGFPQELSAEFHRSGNNKSQRNSTELVPICTLGGSDRQSHQIRA